MTFESYELLSKLIDAKICRINGYAAPFAIQRFAILWAIKRAKADIVSISITYDPGNDNQFRFLADMNPDVLFLIR